jgi:hypothetical protein
MALDIGTRLGVYEVLAARTVTITRFPFTLPEGQQLTNLGRQVVAISPDGAQMVYAANRRLYLRSMWVHAAIREAVKPLATRDEMHEAIANAIEPLATKIEVREEGERTRRHFDVVAESLRGDIQLIAEGQVALQQRFEELRTELKTDIAGLDRRLMRLEAAR